MEDKGTQFAELAKLFSFGLNQYRLYSGRHPASQAAVRNFLARLEPCLGSGSALTLGSAEDRLIINDVTVDAKKIGVGELLREYQRLQIGSLIFEKGITETEISSFFRVMALPPKILEKKGGFSAIFEEANFPHIRLGAARYKKVEEEEEVVVKSEIDGDHGAAEDGDKHEAVQAEERRKIDRMEEVIEYHLKGSDEPVDFDTDRLSFEVEKKPQAVAKLMVARAESGLLLKKIAQVVAQFLQWILAPPFIQEGKDFSPPISRLAREVRRTLSSPETPDDFKSVVEEVVAILERCADAVKIELIVLAFQQIGGDVKALVRILARFLRGKEARERLVGELKARVASLGVKESEFEQALSSLDEEKLTKKPAKGENSSQELEELRRLRDRFEEELARRIMEATVVLEREKQRALDDKERVDAILRNLGEGLVVVDVHGKIQFMNPAAEKLLGMSQAAGRGVPIPQALKDEHLLALVKGPLRDEGDPVTKEIEVQSKNDETRKILQASTAVIENEDGKTVGMVSVLSDITQKKRLDEAKSKFVAHVSHELRTPLVAIDESLAILLREEVGKVPPEQEKFLSIARRNISRLSRLVNDLLDIAKLEAGKLGLNVMSFQVNDMVHHVVETVRSLAGDRRLNIEERYPEENPVIEADADRIIQVVTNLLGNAIKFTPEGGRISVEVNSQWRDPEISAEPCVAIGVHDSGIGIPKEDQQRIFDKFEQSTLSSPAGVGSTGLGLTIAKEIVALHGGKIWVESREGEGSRFTFAIPRRLQNGYQQPH